MKQITDKSFLVGGAVRDIQLGIKAKDLDFVVVGSSVKEMLAAGFKQVGADFPVFLHPESGYEFALARRERSTGDSYKDFVFETDDVTLTEDLKRRDLTINAMAIGESVIDPFGGLQDLDNKVLRHVDPVSFKEDPVRVLRLARFCARYTDFEVAQETSDLCREMVKDGMLSALVPERVTAEMMKALSEKKPSRFFIFLQMVGALEVVFPEIAALHGVPQPYKWHPEGDCFVHTMLVLDQACNFGEDKLIRFCALTHDLGKATTKPEILPSHHGHEDRGFYIVERMCDRLKMPTEFREHAKQVARYHTHVHNTFKLNPKTFLKVFEDLKVNQNKNVVFALAVVGKCDKRGRGSFFENVDYPQGMAFAEVMDAMQELKARDVCTEEELKGNFNVIKEKLYKARVAKAKEVLEQFK